MSFNLIIIYNLLLTNLYLYSTLIFNYSFISLYSFLISFLISLYIYYLFF